MPSAFRDQKNLPDWIELDYHRRRRGLGVWKRRLIWVVAPALSVAAVVLLFVWRGQAAFQAGPVSDAHAMFTNDCSRCHQQMFHTAWRFSPFSAAEKSVPNDACLACHQMPPHNDQLLAEQQCAGCHHEHRGRPALARVPDADCTACHADLKAHSKRGDAAPFRNVTGFPDGHPDLLDRKDPGQLHFNHKRHLEDGGVLGPGRQPKRLDCADCHHLDAAGRYFEPISYRNDCKRCHELTVQLVGSFKGVDPKEIGAFNKEPVAHPHHSAAEVRAELRDRLLRFAQKNPTAVEKGAPDRALPWPPRPYDVGNDEWVWAQRRLEDSQALVFNNIQLPELTRGLFNLSGGCAHCHIEKKPADGGVRGHADLPEYEKTKIPNRWLEHARFDHQRHRLLACTACHDAPNSSTHEDVLLPKMEACAKCHNPTAGVRNDCAECHHYHDRTHELPAQSARTIDDYLHQK